MALRWNDQVRTRWHDAVPARRMTVTPGARPLQGRVAIYAIYPGRGVLAAHLAALRHLCQLGLAPLVVSNLPLSRKDLERLSPLSWRILQRRNFGFDIGGYRAGLSWLGARVAGLDRLVLTNDSIWFPVGAGQDWLTVAARREAQPGGLPDLLGAISNGGMSDGGGGGWRVDPAAPDYHYCSFALSLGPAILRDPDFLPFWRRMRLVDHKVRIVERAEVGFSRWAIGRGHSHAACWDAQGLADRLSTQPLERLLPLIDALIIPEDPALRARRAAFRASDEVRDTVRVVAFLLEVIARTGPAYALPAWTLAEDGIGFLKKSPLRLDPEGRAQTLALLAAVPIFLAEI